MLGTEYIAVAVALRLAAGGSYLVATWKGTVQPNPVTWLCWGVTPLVAFVAQIQDSIAPAAWVTLSLAVGPLLVFVVAVGRSTAWRVSSFDMLCGGCAASGIVLWQISDGPGLALFFSILADIMGGIPTLVKVYREPRSEKVSPYLLSMLGMVVTLLTLNSWKYMNFVFPLYILLIDSAVFGLIAIRSAQLGGAGCGEAAQLPPECLEVIAPLPGDGAARGLVPPGHRQLRPTRPVIGDYSADLRRGPDGGHPSRYPPLVPTARHRRRHRRRRLKATTWNPRPSTAMAIAGVMADDSTDAGRETGWRPAMVEGNRL